MGSKNFDEGWIEIDGKPIGKISSFSVSTDKCTDWKDIDAVFWDNGECFLLNDKIKHRIIDYKNIDKASKYYGYNMNSVNHNDLTSAQKIILNHILKKYLEEMPN